MQCLSTWKFLNRSTKGVNLLKYPLGQKPTVAATLGNKREDKPPRLPTKRRATLVSIRKKCRPSELCAYRIKKYMLVAWPQKLFRRV